MSRSRPGFPLIDLLIVVAVLAILLSILAPTFSRLPDLARRVLCGRKLRYLGNATISHVKDYQWRLPTMLDSFGSSCFYNSSAIRNPEPLAWQAGQSARG